MSVNNTVRRARCDGAANTMAAGPPSLTPKRADFPNPAASMTASISAARSSSVRTFGTGSDSPRPTLSNNRTRQNVDSCSKKAFHSGRVQYSSTWLANPPAMTSSTGPSPNT
jgi:hypothetical protein